MKALSLLWLVTVVMVLGGCQKPLFPENAQRTQYDRYALLRGKARQATQPDAFGSDQPALRERLRPLEQSY